MNGDGILPSLDETTRANLWALGQGLPVMDESMIDAANTLEGVKGFLDMIIETPTILGPVDEVLTEYHEHLPYISAVAEAAELENDAIYGNVVRTIGQVIRDANPEN